MIVASNRQQLVHRPAPGTPTACFKRKRGNNNEDFDNSRHRKVSLTLKLTQDSHINRIQSSACASSSSTGSGASPFYTPQRRCLSEASHFTSNNSISISNNSSGTFRRCTDQYAVNVPEAHYHQQQHHHQAQEDSEDVDMDMTGMDHSQQADSNVLDIAEQPDLEIEDYLYDYYYRKLVYSRQGTIGVN